MTSWTQKGTVSRSIGHTVDRCSLVRRPGIKHRPNVARNGYAEQSNPLGALRHGAGNQPHAQTGEIVQEANAFGKAKGYADGGTVKWKIEV